MAPTFPPPVFPLLPRPGRSGTALNGVRILGIDPGLQRTGFGVIEVDGQRLAYVSSGTISTLEAPRGDLPGRLKLIFDGVREVVDRYAPAHASVEIVFVNVNPQSTLLLGQARGAALAALVAGGLVAYAVLALALGAAGRDDLKRLARRGGASPPT